MATLKGCSIIEVPGPMTTAETHILLEGCKVHTSLEGSAKLIFEWFGDASLKKPFNHLGSTARFNYSGTKVFYMITKRQHKHPTYLPALLACLFEIRKICIENAITELALVRSGDGAIHLLWPILKSVLEVAFSDVPVVITAYEH